MNGVDEVSPGRQHDKVDGIEVLLASEATSQIGSRIGGGECLPATGTQQAEPSVASLVRPIQMLDERLQRNLIAEAIQQLAREEYGHGECCGQWVMAVGIRRESVAGWPDLSGKRFAWRPATNKRWPSC